MTARTGVLTHAMTPAFFAIATAATAAPQAGKRVVPMAVSENGDANVLPFFRWQFTASETGHGISQSPDFSAIHPEKLTDEVPDELFEGYTDDMRVRYLPWTMLDGWNTSQRQKQVEVATLENDLLYVEVTPAWGGQVQRVVHKPTGKDLLLNNPSGHFLTDGGNLRIATAQAIQWNWSPGLIGYSTFNQLPAYIAKVKTERGDVLRIYEWDRWNSTTWQVDLALDGEALLISVTIDNPTSNDTPGYWWTNARFKTSTPYGPCKPDKGMPASRVVAPAWGALSAGQGAWDVALWPKFSADCCGESLNLHGDLDIDNSYLGNYSKSAENWLLVDKGRKAFIAMADRTVYGDTLHGLYHGETRYQKLWAWGQDPMMAWGQSHAWGTCFAELQTGLAPTQEHTFTVRARSNVSQVEVLKPLTGLLNPSAVYSDNYSEAVGAVDAWAASEAGWPSSKASASDAWMREVARRPAEQPLLYAGSSWAAVDALLGDGCAPPPSRLSFVLDENDQEARAWIELARDGTFSRATLGEVPSSFQVGARWERALRRSRAANGPTWLHALHLGVNLAERSPAGIAAAIPFFRESLELRDNAHAWRCLAAIEASPSAKFHLYRKAWAAAQDERGRGAERLRRNLANEYAYALRVFGGTANATWLEALSALVSNAPLAARSDDEVLLGRIVVALYVHRDADEALTLLKTHDFAHYGHTDGTIPGLPSISKATASRPTVAGLWFAALELNVTKGTRSLTALEQKHLRRSHPPPEGVGPLTRSVTPAGWSPPIPHGRWRVGSRQRRDV